MPEPPPYLSLDARVEYLVSNDYFAAESITEEHRARLARMNFHSFLGYARNYRKLRQDGHLEGVSGTPDDVFALIDLDHQVAAHAFSAIRAAELRLRATMVECYCEHHDPHRAFLDPGTYNAKSARDDGAALVAKLVDGALRYGEPYVANHISAAAKDAGLVPTPKRFDWGQSEAHTALLSGLPLWALVDSMSLGTLGRLIETCKPIQDEPPLWERIAGELSIHKSVFLTSLVSMSNTRNSIAHHARLWMNTTTNSPKRHKRFAKRLRGANNKSHYYALVNIAVFLEGESQTSYLAELDRLTGGSQPYAVGIRELPHRPPSGTPSHDAQSGSSRPASG